MINATRHSSAWLNAMSLNWGFGSNICEYPADPANFTKSDGGLFKPWRTTTWTGLASVSPTVLPEVVVSIQRPFSTL